MIPLGDDAATIDDPRAASLSGPSWRLTPGDRFAGRFVVGGVLGTGAHGVVYRAFDERRGRDVALKVLLRVEPERMVRFKREFRVLADVGDPNLVTLHELFVDDARVFFSMELVEGGDFLSWVRGEDEGGYDEPRLRSGLLQLSRGLHALHASGRLHRDLKPTNVLVTRDGQVKLADFGLAMELSRARGADDSLDGVVGTPVYMSPEQAADVELTSATDWYSVGVMLYQALVGHPPFNDLAGVPLMMAKQMGVSERPRDLVPNVPADLDDLCMRLLAVRSADRPDASGVAAALGDEAHADMSSGAARPEEQLFLGRRAELRALDAAWHRHGRHLAGEGGGSGAAVVFVRGPSGMGKTALVRNFARQVVQRESSLIIESRCYERESVPYKGLDGLVDALWTHLSTLPPDEIRESLPPQFRALARVFPVLTDFVREEDDAAAGAEDPIEQRRQAFAALRELLARLAVRHRVLVWIDDLQWCDVDSADLLVELLRPPRPPGLFVVFTHRDDRVDEGGKARARSVALRRVLELLELSGSDLDAQEVCVGPLSDAESVAVARSRGAKGPLARSIAREADGNPLFIAELTRHFASRAIGREAEGDDGGEELDVGETVPTIEQVVAARVARLPADARALLEAVSTAGRPVAQGVAIRVAQVDRAIESVTLLRSHHLLRTEGGGDEDDIDVYHDRVREAVVEGLEPARSRHLHLSLANELELREADPVILTDHLIAAGATERALTYARRSARRAHDALAFNLASRLYRTALTLLETARGEDAGEGSPERRRILVGLADALAHDGRPAEAGPIYIEAARSAPGREAIVLRERGADQLLRSGRVEEGSRELATVLDAVGLRLPSSPQAALVEFLWRRARIGVRGRSFQARTADEVAPEVLLKVDACWSAAVNITAVNLIMGQDLQCLHLLLALDAGEPERVAKALAMETLFSATSGEPAAERTKAVLDDLRVLVDELDSDRARAMERLATGAYWLYRGGFDEAARTLRQAEDALRTRCSDVTWELNMARTLLLQAMFFQGDFGQIAWAAERALEDAIARDNRHDESLLRAAYGPLSRLVADDLQGARVQVQVLAQREHPQFEQATLRYISMLGNARLERYAGDGAASWAVFEDNWSAIKRSLMLSVQPSRIIAHYERSCAALAAAGGASGAARERLLATADRDVRRLERERSSWGGALALLARASLDAAGGMKLRARSRLQHAETELGRGGMAVYAAMARRRRGELMQGDAGRELVDEADRVVRTSGVENPAAMANMLVPAVIW